MRPGRRTAPHADFVCQTGRGQLYNNNFYQGYAPSIVSFVESVRDSQPLGFGTLEDARQVLAGFEMLTRDGRGS